MICSYHDFQYIQICVEKLVKKKHFEGKQEARRLKAVCRPTLEI